MVAGSHSHHHHHHHHHRRPRTVPTPLRTDHLARPQPPLVTHAAAAMSSSTASTLERAIAKLDAMLLAAGAAPAAAPAAAGGVKPVPSASELSTASTSSTNVAAAAGAAGTTGRCVLTTKAVLKVARITAAEKQPNSDKLLRMQADLGPGDSRQIMAGLQAYFPDPAVLVGRLVCVAANLKPAKLAGEPSQAMVLAADTTLPDGTVLVKPLVPPEASSPGDLVHLDGVSPPADPPKVLKLDEWKQVVPGLVVAGGKATFEGTPLMTARGLVTLPREIPDGSAIH